MFGYRLLRERDIESLSNETRDLRARIEQLHGEITKQTADARSKATAVDFLTMQNRLLSEENAVMKLKLTGLPITQAKFEQGNPLTASNLGAEVDLFEDVGDEKARELAGRGLLHDGRRDEIDDVMGAPPSAATLTNRLS